MSPLLALFLWLTLLLGLLCFDPAREQKTSLALWVPTIWMFIVGSRLPAQWLGGQVGTVAEAAFEEGNALDRVTFTALILLAIGILMSRSLDWGGFFGRNLALTAFVFFALASVLWSDLPFVAFKRWFRDLGHYLVVFVALSDPYPTEAVRTLLRRLGYLLIPLSILLIKYYPALGVGYNPWTGVVVYAGATEGKNSLGVVCLVSGLFFFWDTVARWPDRRQFWTRRILFVNLAFLAMTLYLLQIADSQTSRVCLLIGCLVILAAHSKAFLRNPRGVTIAIPAFLCLNLILTFGSGVDIKGWVAEAVGRNPNLTDRTLIWQVLLDAHTNPLIGTGYESFWVGPQLRWVWEQKETAGLNEAHNGYLETYLNLGMIGLLLLASFFLASYRAICRGLSSRYSLASLNLALWTVALVYNVTESAFKWHFMWVAFLLGAIAVPRPSRAGVLAVCAFEEGNPPEGLLVPSSGAETVPR